MGGTQYVNAIGGMDLYAPEAFHQAGLELRFVKSHLREYPQFGDPFVPWLSILDVLMFNSVTDIQTGLLTGYSLIEHEAVHP